MKKFEKILLAAALSVMAPMGVACAQTKTQKPASQTAIVNYTAKVVASYPHDTGAYTQGLFFWNGGFYETTGQYGESSLRKVDLTTGKVLEKKSFSKKYFGEGSCVVDGKLYILTWQNNVAFVYDAATLKYEKAYSYPREGWGLATLPKGASFKGSDKAGNAVMVASDGSSQLFFLDKDFSTCATLNVTFNGRNLPMLNELEWIDGKIWANVYMTDHIVIINPMTGKVEGLIDCSGLIPKAKRTPSMDVLNGIAQAPDGSIYLTGKYWPQLFKITLK